MGKPFNTKQPSNTDSLAPMLAAVFYGQTSITNPDQLAAEGKKTKTVAENLADLATGAQDSLKVAIEHKNAINEQKTVYAKISEGITSIANYADLSTKTLLNLLACINDIFATLGLGFEELRKTQDKGAGDDKGEPAQGVIELVVSGADKGVMKALKDLAEIKIDENSLFSAESLDKFKEYFTKLDEIFKLQSTVGKSAQDALKANEQTKKALKDSEDVAVQGSESVEEIKEGTIAFGELGGFLFRAGITLMIGALFMMIPGMMMNSIKFTIALALFVTGILLPIQLIEKLGQQKIIKDSKGNSTTPVPGTPMYKFQSFIVSAGMLMLIGGLFMMIPGMMKNSLMFGVTLTLFLTMVMLPLTLMAKVANPKNLEHIASLTKLMKGATLVMGIGALFMMLGGGKYVKLAVQFGLYLTIFLAAVLAPLVVYSALMKGGLETLDNVKSLMLAATLVMALGAIFMSFENGKYVLKALMFGVYLAAFIALVLAPILIYSILVFKAKGTLSKVQSLIVTCTIIMIIGALIVSNKELMIRALAFGLLLAVFIGLVLAPFLVFAILAPRVLKSVKWVVGLIIVCTIILFVAYYFFNDWKRVVYALAFVLLLDVFIFSVIFTLKKAMGSNPKALSQVMAVTAVIAVASIMLCLGAWVMSKYGWEAVAFAIVLSAFIFLTIKALDLAAKNQKKIGAGAFAFKQIAIGVGIVSVAIGLLAFIGAEYGWDSVLYSAATLLAFVAGILLIYTLVSFSKVTITTGNIGLKEIGIGMTLFSAAIGILAAIGKYLGWDNVLFAAGVLSGVTAIILLVLGKVSEKLKVVEKGTNGMEEIGIAMMLFSVAIGILAAVGDLFGWQNVVIAAATLLTVTSIILIVLGKVSENLQVVEKGTNGMKEIGISMLLFTVAIGALAVLGAEFGWDNVIIAAATLLTVTVILIKVLANCADKLKEIGKGGIAVILLSAGVLTMSLAIGFLGYITKEYGWDNVLIAATILTAVTAILIAVLAAAAAAIAPIGMGAAAILAMGVAMGLMTLCIWGVCAIVKEYGDLISEAPLTLLAFIGGMVLVFGACALAGIAGIGALIGLALMSPAMFGLIGIVTLMGIAIQIYRKGAEGYDLGNIRNGINTFLSLADCAPGLFGAIKLRKKMGTLRGLVANISWTVHILADAIAHFSSLRIPTKWNKDGVAIRFRQLKTKDFKEAADGIKYLMVTLSQAIFTTYEQYPDFFGWKAWWILYKIRRLVDTQQYIMFVLMEGIKAYAQLMIPTKWDKEGKPIKFKLLKTEDFKQAADGIGYVMTTLAGAMMKTYNDNKGWLFENDYFFWILRQLRHLAVSEGFILHVLSQGIKSYAQIMIPTKWNKDGVATNFRQMTNQEFEDAALNIGAVMTLMAYALKSVWSGGTYTVYTSTGAVKVGTEGDGLGWFTFLIPYIAGALTPLGALISNIAIGLQSYASLVVPDNWDKKGRPIHFRQMTNEEFQSAGANIGLVITTLAKAVSDAYDTLMPKGWWAAWFGDSPEKKIKAMQPLGELVSSLAAGLQAYASMQIPTRWDRKGRPVAFSSAMEGTYKYTTLWRKGNVYGTWEGSGSFFEAAGENIKTVLLLLTYAVNNAYWSIPGDANYIQQIIKAFVPMGELVSALASGLQAYASLAIPIAWDKNGKPTQFKSVGEGTYNYTTIWRDGNFYYTRDGKGSFFEAAGENIKTVLRLMAFAVNAAYWSIPGDANQIKEIINAFVPMGDLIAGIASGLQAYANLQVPMTWKDGKPATFRPMTSKEIIKAGLTISDILFLMGKTIMGTWYGGDIELDSNGTTVSFGTGIADFCDADEFTDIIGALSEIGGLITNTAAGIQSYANLQIPTKWNAEGKPIKFRPMTKSEFAAAGKNIGSVLKFMSQAIIAVWYGEAIKTPYGAFKTGDDLALSDFCDAEEFKEIIEALGKIGGLISGVAEGIGKMASLQIATKWDSEGKPIAFMKLSDQEFLTAGENISKVMTTIFAAVIKTITDNADYFSDDSNIVMGDAFDAIAKVSGIIKGVADGINTFANGGIPTYDKEGKIIGRTPITTEMMDQMCANIETVLLSTTCAVITAGLTIDAYMTGDEFKSALDNVKGVSDIVKNLAEGIKAWAELKVAEGWYSDGSAKGYRQLKKEDFENAKQNIIWVVTYLVEGVISAYHTTFKAGGKDYTLEAISNSGIIGTVLDVIQEVTDITKTIAEMIKSFAEMRIPTGWYSDGSAKGYEKITESDIKNFAHTMEVLVTEFPKTFLKIIEENPSYFDEKFGQNINKIYTILGSINSILTTLVMVVDTFNEVSPSITSIFEYSAKSSNKDGNKLTVGLLIDTYSVVSDILAIVGVLVEKESELGTLNDKIDSFIESFTNIGILMGMLSSSVIGPLVDCCGELDTLIKCGVMPKNSKFQLRATNNVYCLINDVMKMLEHINSFETPGDGSAVITGTAIFMDVLYALIQNVVFPSVESFGLIHSLANKTSNSTDKKALKLIFFDDLYTIIVDMKWMLARLSLGINIFLDKLIASFDFNAFCLQTSLFNAVLYNTTVAVLIPLLKTQNVINKFKQDGGKALFDTLEKVCFNVETFLEKVSEIDYHNVNDAIRNNIVLEGLLLTTFIFVKTILKNAESLNTLFTYTPLTKNVEALELFEIKLFSDVYTLLFESNKLIEAITKELSFFGMGKIIKLTVFNKQILTFSQFIENIYKNGVGPIFALGRVLQPLYTTVGNRKDNPNGYNIGSINDIEGLILDINTLLPLISTTLNPLSIVFIGNCLTYLGKGLSDIVTAVEDYKYSNDFKNLSEDLNNFIHKTVNEIDIEKIDRLIELSNSLNNLADKTTNLDALTKAIAEDLTVSLGNLANRMDESKQVIQLSEEIQQKRYDLITRVIGEMKRIINTPINVEISVKDSDSPSDSAGAAPGNSSVTPSDTTTPGNAGSATADETIARAEPPKSDKKAGSKVGAGALTGKTEVKAASADTATLKDLANRIRSIESDVTDILNAVKHNGNSSWS